MSQRNQALDILRAFAVILVLFRHMSIYAAMGIPPKLNATTSFLQRGGWVGVDLFFVLSGFLISRLLFKEHQKFGALSFKNFFIRRGFKIYPAYYLMLFVTAAVLCARGALGFRQLIDWSVPWLFYLQDYWQTPLASVWGHTWSLAIEEQFYIFIPLLFIWLEKRGPREDPFKKIPFIFFTAALACFVMRLVDVSDPGFKVLTHMRQFHVRIDSLLCGVFISYLCEYSRWKGFPMTARSRSIFFALGAVLLLPAFMVELEGSRFLYAAGFVLFYAGSGLMVMSAVSAPARKDLWARALAYIGARSYSIYLWHLPVIWSVYYIEFKRHGAAFNQGHVHLYYFAASLFLGIVVSNALEFPVLKLRDRWYPSRAG